MSARRLPGDSAPDVRLRDRSTPSLAPRPAGARLWNPPAHAVTNLRATVQSRVGWSAHLWRVGHERRLRGRCFGKPCQLTFGRRGLTVAVETACRAHHQTVDGEKTTRARPPLRAQIEQDAAVRRCDGELVLPPCMVSRSSCSSSNLATTSSRPASPRNSPQLTGNGAC
jgi:hypothetical protein